MFRRRNPFVDIYQSVRKPAPNMHLYPPGKGRFADIESLVDETFPAYNANVIGSHVLLEGPNQCSALHISRFLTVLMHDMVTDVIAAGNPLDGRRSNHSGRGFLNYFAPEDEIRKFDQSARRAVSKRIQIQAEQIQSCGQIVTYLLSLQDAKSTKNLNVHNIPNFGDFKTVAFTLEEINRILEIFNNAKGLAIHCSAGMGRTGVLELAYQLYQKFDHFYPQGKPDLSAIRNQLEALRKFRPELIQGHEQYRMAIILGMQLYFANQEQLTEEKNQSLTATVDLAAANYQDERQVLRMEGELDLEGFKPFGLDLDEESDSDEPVSKKKM